MHRWTCTLAHTCAHARAHTHLHLTLAEVAKTHSRTTTDFECLYVPMNPMRTSHFKGVHLIDDMKHVPAKKLRISLDIFSQHWNAGATLVHCYLPGAILPKFSSNLLLDQSACMVVFHIQRPAPFHFGNSTNHGGLWQKRTHLGNFGNFSFHCAKLTNRNRNCFEQFWKCSWWNSFQLPRLPQLATATCAIMTFTYQLSILPCYMSFRHGVANASMP